MVAQLHRDQKANEEANSGREHERALYLTLPLVKINITHPGGNEEPYLVRPHNISAGGMAFLHGQFLYNDTPCKIELATQDKQTVIADSTVVFCRLVKGNVHEIGVMFEETINVEDFTSAAA